eukprot:m.206619 g.206619  ORF g.206619 m.206619 type:complete len:55 (+) comp15430_c0_seq1:189-353(+)
MYSLCVGSGSSIGLVCIAEPGYSCKDNLPARARITQPCRDAPSVNYSTVQVIES